MYVLVVSAGLGSLVIPRLVGMALGFGSNSAKGLIGLVQIMASVFVNAMVLFFFFGVMAGLVQRLERETGDVVFCWLPNPPPPPPKKMIKTPQVALPHGYIWPKKGQDFRLLQWQVSGSTKTMDKVVAC